MEKLKQAQKDGVVLGLREVASVVPRRDIDVLLKQYPDTFNLLLIALTELQGGEVPEMTGPGDKVPSSDKMSWYQLAGIHGLPHSEWDGEKWQFKDSKVKWAAYCTHGEPHFALWHRPYLALLEQALYHKMSTVVSRFNSSTKLKESDKQKYRDALNQFRLPYWDYYRARNYDYTMPGVKTKEHTTMAPYDYHLPQIFTLPQVMVKTLPDNQLKPIDNPFYQYKFESSALTKDEWDAAGLNTSIVDITKRTLRYGSMKDPVGALNETLNKVREDSMRISMCMIELGIYSNFRSFSTDGVTVKGASPDDPSRELTWFLGPPDGGRTAKGSIEGLHNSYHGNLGGASGQFGAGHMSRVPVAAFDPVFWIHHCQIDRLFAIWQSANTGHWFDELPTEGTQNLINRPLVPFRKYPLSSDPKQRYWTPDLAKDTTALGYTYPDIWNKNDADQIRDDFARSYGWGRRLTPFQKFGEPSAEMAPLDLSTAQVYQYSTGVASADLFVPLRQKKGTFAAKTAVQKPREEPKVSQEWYIDTIVERLAMNGTFSIFYVIGDISDASDVPWVHLPGFGGLTHVFTMPTEICDNCGQQQEQAKLVTDTTPITSLLLDYVETGELRSMNPDDVKPFLIKHLKWRAQTVIGTVVDPRDLTRLHNLKLSISTKTAPLPGQTGQVAYANYPEVIDQIISHAS